MVKIISSTKTTLHQLESPVHQQSKRDYLGMSVLGHECTRYLWFHFRWAFTEEFTDRQRRLFNRGHREEPAIIESLERIGIKVHSEQKEFIAGFGHIRGHCDGICENVPEAPKTPHLLEMKTMNDRNFKEMCKKGVKASKPVYFGQCQVGMRGYKLSRTLFVAVNKNDDAYYVERLREDKEIGDMLISRGTGVILSEVPAPKLYKPTWILSKWCGARDICHYDKPMDVNCRTCQYAEPAQEAKWNCTKHGIELGHEDQELGCENHSYVEIV